jgi:hypothetical protein
MPLMIGINVGFITNSSSCVYHFPKSLLEDPQIKAFLTAFECEDGFVGDNLWHRGQCGTLAITREQKEEAQRQLQSPEYEGSYAPSIDVTNDDQLVVIYGDEYQDLANIIFGMLRSTCERLGIQYYGGEEYN